MEQVQQFLPFILMFAVIYFFMIRPQAKKQKQEISSFKAEVEGFREQVDDAKPFKKITVVFYLDGKVDPKKAFRSAQLSFEKYCSVSKTLELMATIHYKVVVNGEEVFA